VIILILYVVVVPSALAHPTIIRAVEQMGRALEDIASTMKKDRI
jgi:hypothetical protein